MADSNLKIVITAVDKASGTIAKTGRAFDGMSIAAGAAAAGVAALGLSAIRSASDLNETTSKVQQVFGDAAGTIEDFAGTAAQSMGQSKRQAMDAAATFALFGKAAGKSGEDLADFSTDFVGLASDLASFNNTTPQEAIEAIGAALRGESEPIRKYGVLLDDATLRQEALSQGLIKTTKDALTPQNRVLAASALIFKQTKDAQGDFARTSDGLANKQRILAAEFENAKAQLGDNLLPIANNAVGVFNSLLRVVGGLPQPVQMTALGVVAVGSALVIAVPKVVEAVEAFRKMAGASALSRAQLALAAGGAVAAGAALGVVVGKAIQLDGKIDAVRQSVRDLNAEWSPENLAKVSGAYEELAQENENTAEAARTLQDDTARLTDRFRALFPLAAAGFVTMATGKNTFEEMAEAVREGYTELTKFEQPIRDVASELGTTEEAVRKVAETTYDSSMSYLDNKAALERMVRAQIKGTGTSGRLATAQQKLADTGATVEEKIKAYREQLDLLDGGNLDAQESQDRVTRAMRDAATAFEENGGKLRGNSTAALDNRETMRGLVETWRDHAETTYKVTGNQGEANAKLREGRTAIMAMAEKLGLSKTAARQYADSLYTIPKKRDTKADFKKDSDAKTYKETVKTIPKSVFTSATFATDPESKSLIMLWTQATAGSPAQARAAAEIDRKGGLTGTAGKRALGGPVMAGRSYLVGERGPEVVTFGDNGYVTPNNRLGGGPTIVIQSGIGDPRAIASEVRRVLAQADSRGW